MLSFTCVLSFKFAISYTFKYISSYFFFSFVTDTILVLTYYLAGHSFWAFSTVALAVIPASIIQAFSIRWHVLDNAASIRKWLSHCCLLGIFFRHVDALKTGLEARRSGDVADFQALFHQQSDISMLQLFESFMKSAPQLVLQVYIMVQIRDWGPWTGNIFAFNGNNIFFFSMLSKLFANCNFQVFLLVHH